MPLRAKIFAGQAQMSTEPEIPRELPGDDPDDVHFGTIYGVRTVELNRPQKLNSLNASMARKIIPRLKEWEKSQLANVIVIKGAGSRAFCAGGDVAELAKDNTKGPAGVKRSRGFFGLEYNLDHIVATYPKPYVAFMDGITMGGGVGLSVHAPFRIATERTVFAMPETTIGFFPDVGGSFFLPRLDGEVGTYLALTSERLKGVNALYVAPCEQAKIEEAIADKEKCRYAGIATHYIHSSSLPDLEARLSELVFKDYASLQERFQIIDHTIEEFVTGLPEDEPLTLVGGTREAIDRCFGHDTIEAILSALAEEGTPWAKRTIQALQERSPTAVRVTLRQMRLGRRWSIAEAFQREYHIAGKMMDHPDFVEGVSARLIRKPAEIPKWQPTSLESANDVDTESFFKVEGEQKLQLININSEVGDYHEYPHGWLNLPSERDIEFVVREGQKTASEVIEHFVEVRRGKAGVREKVSEVLARKTRAAEDHGSNLSWISST